MIGDPDFEARLWRTSMSALAFVAGLVLGVILWRWVW